jgi:hypothetical protein
VAEALFASQHTATNPAIVEVKSSDAVPEVEKLCNDFGIIMQKS